MNPLFMQKPANNNVNNMMQMIKAAQDPSEALKMAANTNPALAGVLKSLNGRDPKTVFFETCRQKGIDPNVILEQLK